MFFKFQKGNKYCFELTSNIKLIAMKFMSRIVVTSQSMNKKFGAPTPSCFVYKQVNAQNY